jgi:hypothetical protein
LLKTFYGGPGGWAERQLADGTIVLTAPTGHTYTTTPDGAAFFPTLAAPTGQLIIPEHTDPPSDARGIMLPRRKRTRATDRHYRIAAERAINQARIDGDEPPRFRLATRSVPFLPR